jgi:mono/diheme cytochrome c family protein
MKGPLILFVGLVFSWMFLSAVHAGESQVSTGQVVAEETSSERNTYAESLFKGRCQMCHQLPEPSMLRPQQWKLILTTMQQRMQQAGVPPLTQEETDRLLEYLAAQAR